MLTDALNKLRTHPNPDEMREMLFEIANAFIDADESKVDQEERRLFGDFIATALDRLGEEMKALVAEMVCDSMLMPTEITARLARHEVPEVALPFLEFSPTLGDNDLVVIAKTAPEDRQIAIAHRDAISPKVSDALIEHGSDNVLVALSDNMRVEYSNIGLARLLHRVGDNPLVQASLARRSTQQHGFDRAIFDSVDGSLRKKLGAFLRLIDADAYQVIVRSAAEGVAQRAGEELTNRMARHAALQKVRAGAMTFDAAFASFCTSERPQDCIRALSERLSLPEALVNSNFSRPESDRIAILCKAADISEATYAAFTRLRLVTNRRPAEEFAHLIREYASIDPAQARRAARIVRLRFGANDPGAAEILELSA